MPFGRVSPLPLFPLLLLAAAGLSAQEPAPPGSPIPSGPPPKYEIEADPAALREAEAEKAAAAAAPQAVEVARARMADEPGSAALLSVERFGPGARPEISRQGDLLAYDKVGEGSFRAVYTSRLDGSRERCLSCSRPELEGWHAMAPTWHPRGDLLVVLGQKSAARLALDEARLAGPARSLHGELWALSSDGQFAWQLTRAAAQGHAVGDPVFSHEGGQLAWSERETSEPGPWGKWVVQVGDLKVRGGVPRLGKVLTFDPSPFGHFVQVVGFTPDDQGLILLLHRTRGEKALGRFDLKTREFTLLTRDDEEAAAFAEIAHHPWTLWATRGEVWMISPSTRGRERLTTFGEPASRHFLGQVEIQDLATGPDGQTLVVDLFVSRDGAPPAQMLYLVRFDLNRLGPAR